MTRKLTLKPFQYRSLAKGRHNSAQPILIQVDAAPSLRLSEQRTASVLPPFSLLSGLPNGTTPREQ
jgi:hypothetical protein